jgi:hypothetical protein
MKKKFVSIGLSVCLSGMFLTGCAESPDPATRSYDEFTYTNKYGEEMHCIGYAVGYTYGTMACIPDQTPKAKP